MTTLAFIVPAYRRFDLSRACLTQLRRTCVELTERGIQATAVVVGDDENIDVAEMLGFKWVRRENKPLGRKWNDGIEYAAKELGVEFVAPFGTDNWIDADVIVDHLPDPGKIRIHRLVTLVHEDGEKMGALNVSYPGGDGIRIMPTEMLQVLNFRPCEEDRNRATDTSMRDRLGRALGAKPPFQEYDKDPLQIISFQSPEQQLNDYRSLRYAYPHGPETTEVWKTLAERYPIEAVDEVRGVFARRRGLVAA